MALAALYAPAQLVDAGLKSAGLLALSSVVLFVLPMWCWLRYARVVRSSGGLSAFVEAAVGPRTAHLHAAIWGVSYYLYLIYTVTFIVDDQLPLIFVPGPGLRLALLVLFSMGVAGFGLLDIRKSALVITVLAVGQVAVLASLLAAGLISSNGAVRVAAPTNAGAFGQSAVGLSLLYVCGSLPLYLGGEVRGGAVTVRRGLLTGFAIAGGGSIAMALALMGAASGGGTDAGPGLALALASAGPLAAKVVGVGLIASVLGVELAEFVALGRLLRYVTRRPQGSVNRGLVLLFLAGSGVSLLDPQRVYADLITPSLVALWLSQLIVFAVYPVFTRRHGRTALSSRVVDVLLAGGSSALMGFGLYLALCQPSS